MKKITRYLIALSIIVSTGNSFGQFSTAWTAQFQHTTLPGFSNEGRRIAEDANGNIFQLSDVTSDLDPQGIHSASTYHYVNLAKYSTNGVLIGRLNVEVKNHVVSGYDNYSAFGLEVDASNNVYFGCAAFSNGSASFDVVLSKYDNNLAPVWQNYYTINGSGRGMDLKVTSTGIAYAIVQSTYLFNTYSTLIKSASGSAFASLVYAYPSNGPVINSLALGGTQTAYLAGYSTKGGFKNAYVAAINLTSNTLTWSSGYTNPGFNGNDVANKITVGVDGNIYTVGYTDLGAPAGVQPLVLRNLVGNPRFDFVVVLKGGPANNNGLLINAAESGWVYIGAASATTVSVFRIPDNGIFSVAGNIEYSPVPSASFTSITGVSLNAMKISNVKNIYITGGVSATGPSGAFTSCYLLKSSVVFGNALIRAGGPSVDGDFGRNLEGLDLSLDYPKSDVYLLRNYWENLHSVEKVELLDVSVPSPLRYASQSGAPVISISPNPASDFVTFTADATISSVEVFDITGNRILKASCYASQTSINTTSLTPGIYICKVRTDAGESTMRLVRN